MENAYYLEKYILEMLFIFELYHDINAEMHKNIKGLPVRFTRGGKDFHNISSSILYSAGYGDGENMLWCL